MSTMAASTTNKYAGLPDIDLDQQDIYETPDLLDEVSTVPVPRHLYELTSQTSVSDDDDEDIERHSFSTKAARQRFANERVDADSADFSDTLIARQKKQSYRTSRPEVTSSPETLEEKIARVRREMEEVRTEMLHENKSEAEIVEWESLVHSLAQENNATKLLTSRLSRVAPPDSTKALAQSISPNRQSTTYALSYSPSEATQLSTLSSRLSTLESLLGLPFSQSNTPPILPTLTHLSKKVNLLTSQSQIDAISQRIKSLTADLSTLEEKREQARQRALLDPEDAPQPQQEDLDTAHKIDALYATLGTIDQVAPIVPGVLERLRSMRIVHADAAGVTEGIKELGAKLGKMEVDVKEWDEAVKNVERGLKEVSGRVVAAVERIEEITSGLERRAKGLEI